MQTKLSHFIRHGRGAVTLRLAPSRKEAPPPDPRWSFANRLVGAARENERRILGAVGEALGIDAADLAPANEEGDAALAAWDARADLEDPTARQEVEDEIVRVFARDLNARRQGALGIGQYVWRSRDDEDVRPGHAEHDDDTFDWDEPPEGGHPGEAPNCRCRAEPVLPEIEAYETRTGADLALYRMRAEASGMGQALRSLGADALAGVGAGLGLARWADRWLSLRLAALRGLASEADLRDLAEREAAFAARLDQVAAGVRTLLDPATAAAFLDYVRAARARPALVADLYARGLATEGQLWAAHEERARLDTLILSSVLPSSLPRRALGALGHSDLPEDRRGLASVLRDEAVRLRRDPTDLGLPRVQNPGIPWGGGIMAQGMGWEDALERDSGLVGRLPQGFQTFDFYDEASATATSAKTLDTMARTYIVYPQVIFRRLRGYIDRAIGFDRDDRFDTGVNADTIGTRRIELAIPATTGPEQLMHLQRAIEYAADNGIELRVTLIE